MAKIAACSEDFHGGDDFDWDASEAIEKIAIVEKVYHKCFQNKNLPFLLLIIYQIS